MSDGKSLTGYPIGRQLPTWQHQSISRELLRQISNYLLHKPYQVFAAPFDLCIPELNETDEICDESKLRKTGYFG
ncbi:hypothetical protein [Desulfosporosinus acididurans]|uniref:hypothetical protein n=1 Tax=Desulfosporosinus acididurans TaxID=476652 RepID=UPI00128C2BCF|nr:hypothetical protein [Desulfosporosinus acididurans]